jgi:hypothetical protein
MTDKELSSRTTLNLLDVKAIRDNCAVLIEYALYDTKLRFTFYSSGENIVSFISLKTNEYGIPFGITFYQKGTGDASLFAQATVMKTEHGQNIGILNIPVDFNETDNADYVKEKILEYLALYPKIPVFTLVKVRMGNLRNDYPVQMVIQGTEEEISNLIKNSNSSSGCCLFGYVNYSKEKGPSIPRFISLSNTQPFVIDIMGPVDERWENLSI